MLPPVRVRCSRLALRLSAVALCVSLALAAALAGAGAAWAELTFPALTGRVVDAGRVLDPATRCLLYTSDAADE